MMAWGCALKRLICDQFDQFDMSRLEVPDIESNGRWVAIVGSGAAGPTGSHDLALMAYGVAVSRVLSETGAMFRVGIKQYRLPKDTSGTRRATSNSWAWRSRPVRA